MDKRSPSRSEVDIGRRMDREFYKQLSEIVQKWEQAFANLEVDQQRRIVSAAAESGLLQAIQMSRAALKGTSGLCNVVANKRVTGCFCKEARRWLADYATCAVRDQQPSRSGVLFPEEAKGLNTSASSTRRRRGEDALLLGVGVSSMTSSTNSSNLQQNLAGSLWRRRPVGGEPSRST
jgi:hypothetical protein